MDIEYLKKYKLIQDKYEDMFKGSIQIPSIHIFKNQSDNQLYSFQIWFTLPSLLPLTDYIQVGRVIAGLITKQHYIKDKVEYRFLKYSDFMAAFGDLFDNYDKDIPQGKIILSDKMVHARKRIDTLFQSNNYPDMPELEIVSQQLIDDFNQDNAYYLPI